MAFSSVLLLLIIFFFFSLIVQSEVNFLGQLSHPNLVRLLGYCWEDKELLLVYEFMQRGSLKDHLFRSRKLRNCENIIAFEWISCMDLISFWLSRES